MFTVFSFRDMGWLIAVTFAIGSAAFIAVEVLTLIPAVRPDLASPTMMQAGSAIIGVGGGGFFFVGFLGSTAAFDVDRGQINSKLEGPQVYKPALLGSKDWVWFPSWAEIRTVYLPSTAFRAGLLQLVGGVIFSTLLLSNIPGLIDLSVPRNVALFVAAPQILGGWLFLGAALLSMHGSDFQWYRPQPWVSAG
ncbi:hypothetical protein VTK73DRAFT_6560 [Phialemonium thermophilum]|uniref:Uncharacterized protein n=1 Tax=Phialemonium thermophilum TaxID=223376 RepID=A0ABR3XWF8_9PEZI